jgi:ABC-type transport system involved in multi-copper enzyme maturation permease subunit
MQWILLNPWSVGLLIVVIGLLIGFRDVVRFSLTRIWAISSVVWQESKRKRVLLITPLAIIGVIIVSQFQNPLDAQDAIRQTTKFCLFATGLLVAITAIILAATNLPKEIENRVIYTVVTKPTTRLEIVLGKVLGFARVSAAILLIMGLFTWGYLWLRERQMTNSISVQLAAGNVDPVSKQTLEHYVSAGLLQSRSY